MLKNWRIGLAIMVGGRLVALQSVATLRNELATSARLRVVLTKLESTSIEAAARAGAGEVNVEGNSLMMNACPEDRLEILRAIEAAGGQIQSFGMEELSLEDVYMKYVNDENVDAK